MGKNAYPNSFATVVMKRIKKKCNCGFESFLVGLTIFAKTIRMYKKGELIKKQKKHIRNRLFKREKRSYIGVGY